MCVCEANEGPVVEEQQGRCPSSQRGKSGKKQVCVRECDENTIPRFKARKNLRETKKRDFPRQNKTRSDGEKHSPTQEYLFIICIYDLRGKKQMPRGSDAGRYLIL